MAMPVNQMYPVRQDSNPGTKKIGCLGCFMLFLAALSAAVLTAGALLIYFIALSDPFGILIMNHGHIVRPVEKPSRYDVITAQTTDRTIPLNTPFIVLVLKPSTKSTATVDDKPVFSDEDKKAAKGAHATWMVAYVESGSGQLKYNLKQSDIIIVSNSSDALNYWIQGQNGDTLIVVVDPSNYTRTVQSRASLIPLKT